MKVLLRIYNGEPFVWKKAEAKNATQFTLEDGSIASQIDIVSISRDNRKKFVICSACGAIIKNTPEAIKEHKERASTSAICFGCRCLKENSGKQLSAKYTLQEDGSYIVNTKKNAKLSCVYSYRYFDINSQNARDICIYKNCATAEMRSINDVFTKYPGLFDDMITVDKVLDNGFTERTECENRNVVWYKLKARNNITAVVNKLNIVDHFVIDYRSHTIQVVYSKKYNKSFIVKNGGYRELNGLWFIPDNTLANIKAKIASLYN